MATVYLAEQESLARLVAIKVLNADLCQDEAYVARFQHEARAAASLVHSNIAQIYEVGVSEGRYYLSQEYLAGGTLGRQLEKQGPLSADRAWVVMREVALALEAAAAKGLVHRDIKPDNLLLDRSGAVKVADFGLARSTEPSAPGLTQEGVTLGTPLYMSPEQIEGKPVDSRSDLYSLGVTIYHLLAGAPPFVGETAMGVAAQHLRETAPALDAKVPGLPTNLVDITHRLMAKHPADRFDSPRALLKLLGESSDSLSRITTADSQQAKQLQDAMESMTKVSRSRSWNSNWVKKISLGVLATLLGISLGLVFRPAGLLANATRRSVEREESVTMQLYRAKILDTNNAWLAVEEYYPDADEYYHLLALRGLTESLFAEGDYHAAIRPLTRLAAHDSDEPEFGLFGKAGLVVANTQIGRHKSADQARGQLPVDSTSRDELQKVAPLMAEALEQAEKDLESKR